MAEQRQVRIHMTPHDTIVAALTLEATVDIFDRSQAPVYEPLVFAKVLDIAEEYGYTHDVTTREFLRTVAILDTAKHIKRVRCVEPRVGGGPSPHLEPTPAGRLDIKASRKLLRRIIAHGS